MKKYTIFILSLAAVFLICLASCEKDKEPDCNVCHSVMVAKDVNGVIDASKTFEWTYKQETEATCLMAREEYKEIIRINLDQEVLLSNTSEFTYSYTLECE